MHLADTAACAVSVGVKPDNIRHWAMRHPDLLPKRGHYGSRTLYALEDVAALAELMKQRSRLPCRSQP